MTHNRQNVLASAASCRGRGRLAQIALSLLLAGGLMIQTPATAVLLGTLARLAPATSVPSSEEERPAETSEIPAVELAASQGRRMGRGLSASPRAVRMPLLCASGCIAARHHDGGRMLVCDVRLGAGLPLRL